MIRLLRDTVAYVLIVLMSISLTGCAGWWILGGAAAVATILTGSSGDKDDTTTDSSVIIVPPPLTPAQVVLSTVQTFTQQVADNNISEAMGKMDFVNDTEKAVNESFYNDPVNKPMIDDFCTALKNATIKKESKNYMILELTSPTIGKYEIWMIKRGNEWKIAD